jgi:hypothetical protein
MTWRKKLQTLGSHLLLGPHLDRPPDPSLDHRLAEKSISTSRERRNGVVDAEAQRKGHVEVLLQNLSGNETCHKKEG